MRRALTLAALALTGCGSFFQHLTGNGTRLNTGDTWPHEVEYELLTSATGRACAAEDALPVKKGRSVDPALNGPPALFEQAKYIAIGSVKDADGLAAIRSWAEDSSGVVCVTVTGRAYRIISMRATSGGHTRRSAKVQPFEDDK